MRIILTMAAAGTVALLASSCATLSEDQCLAGNWQGIGYSDGAQGYGAGRLNDHAEACAEYGITPNADLYYAGREQGLYTYCTPGNGFSVGRSGSSYSGVCPGAIEADFLTGYSDGRLVHAAEQALNAALNDETYARNLANDLENQIRAEEDRLADGTLTDAEREATRQRLRRLRQDRENAQAEARDAQWAAREARREADALRARFAAYYGGW